MSKTIFIITENYVDYDDNHHEIVAAYSDRERAEIKAKELTEQVKLICLLQGQINLEIEEWKWTTMPDIFKQQERGIFAIVKDRSKARDIRAGEQIYQEKKNREMKAEKENGLPEGSFDRAYYEFDYQVKEGELDPE